MTLRTTEEYREWWVQERPDIPYGSCWCGCGESTPLAPWSSFARALFKGEPHRYVARHHSRKAVPLTPTEYRKWWEKQRPDIPFGDCWCGCGEKTTMATDQRPNKPQVKGQPVHYLLGHNARISPIDYIEEDRGYDTPCWVWQRALSDTGYGTAYENGKYLGAHRLYYLRHKGEIPAGLILHHLCEVRPCVNPEHLKPVTYAENTRFAARTKLTPSLVRQIRGLRGSYTYNQLGEMFGVHGSQISRVMNRQKWADV